MLHTLLLAMTAWLSFGNSRALTCHCLNNAQCNPSDGSCPDGCEKGWYGPGCQVGNLAFRRPAAQSSTYSYYTADNAVNGIMPPPGDESEWNCSHTAEAKTGTFWWYVNLSDSEDFVLKNITIVNRQGTNSKALKNFYILYTSNPSADPDPKTWEQCAFQKESQSTTVATYTCENGTAIGRRVAIYLIASGFDTNNKLTLCEVFVDGYSYDVASEFQLVNTYTRTGCENFQVNFSTLSIVPPTYLVVQLRNYSYGDLTAITIIHNPVSGMSSVTVPAMANRTYAVSVAPETCCIGAQCLNEGTLDHSKCVVGQSTQPVLVTMPLYGQYALRKFGNVINVTTVNTNTCTSKNQRITCSQSEKTGRSLAVCSSNSSCQLDPRFSYSCALDVTFSDNFTQTSQENFHVSTADFSTFTLSKTVTCNAITLLIQNITSQWDLEPSFIEFYVSSTASNDTKSYRVPAQRSGTTSVKFSVLSNATYLVWAVPVTYWGIAPAVSNGSCRADSGNCIVGYQTPVQVVSTPQHQYILKTQGCRASIADVSSVDCETTVLRNITCKIETNEAVHVFTSENGSICCLKPNANVTCNYSVYVDIGIVEMHSQFWEIVNLIDCATPETSDYSPLDSPSTPAVVGGTVAGLIVLIIVFTLLVFVYRRGKVLKKDKAFVKPPIIATRDSVLMSANGNLETTDEAVYGNTVGMGIDEFERYSRNEAAIFTKFSELRSNEGHPCSVGLKNIQKNRFKNIVPYDMNRVPISDGTCNYINASYINGYNQDKKYIATQGPIASTISDFWNMVWQEKVSLIVMLTDYVEQSKKKCDRYFPRTSSDTGGISVTVETESTFDTHSVTVLNVCHNGITRVVRHCHFLAWPDKSVPEHCSHLLLFYASTRELLLLNNNNQKAPVVVHCSAGVGRTGAFIALDYLLSRFFAEGRVDVDSCVLQLRDQRMNMVQTKEQYTFLHKVLLYSMKTFEFIRNSTDLMQNSARSRPQFEKFTSKEFEILQASLNDTPDESVYISARSKENLHKNRDPEILARENKRPYLGAVSGSLGGYINAVYCNGCYAKNAFIATQWPLKDTVAEFWELVYDRNPSCIVLLHQSPSPEEYPEFYPQPGQSLTAGSILVTGESSRENQMNNAKEYDLLVKLLSVTASDQETSRTLRLLECNVFEFGNEIPTDLEQTTSLIMSLQLASKQSNDRPIIVVCKDGAKFCGLFMAATNALHRLLESKQVQVFHTVDLLKASRPQFINSLEQYRCLYQLISCSTEASTLYANLSSSSEQ